MPVDLGQIVRDRIIAYKQCFDTEAGKIVLADLERQTTLSHASLGIDISKPVDPLRIVVDEAQRKILLYILNHVRANPDKAKMETITGDATNV